MFHLFFQKLADQRLLCHIRVPEKRVEFFFEGARVEKLFELFMEDLELFHERSGIAGAGSADALQDLRGSDQVFGAGAAMQLVLQFMLDLLLNCPRDIVPMRNVPNTGQRFGPRKSRVCRRQPGVYFPNNIGVGRRRHSPEPFMDLNG